MTSRYKHLAVQVQKTEAHFVFKISPVVSEMREWKSDLINAFHSVIPLLTISPLSYQPKV